MRICTTALFANLVVWRIPRAEREAILEQRQFPHPCARRVATYDVRKIVWNLDHKRPLLLRDTHLRRNRALHLGRMDLHVRQRETDQQRPAPYPGRGDD